MMNGRPRATALVALLALMLLSGCVTQDDDDDGANGSDGTTGGDGGSGDGGAPGENGGDEEQTGPAPPREQRKDSVDEITRPGEYAILEDASGASGESWNVPTWSTDDWWRWEVLVSGGATCAAELLESVAGTGTEWQIDVYRLDAATFACGSTNPAREYDVDRTVDHLTRLSENGYINHETLFPLHDGKRWAYMNSGNSLVHAEVEYLETYTFDLQIVEAWRVTLEYQGKCMNGECDEIVKHQWYGVDQANLLKEEIYVNDAATPSTITQLTDSARGTGGLLPLGPIG